MTAATGSRDYARDGACRSHNKNPARTDGGGVSRAPSIEVGAPRPAAPEPPVLPHTLLGKLGPVGFDDPHALLKELSPALAGLSLRVSPDISRDGRGANYGGFEGVFVPSPRNHRWWVECRCLHSRRLQSKDARFGAQRRKKRLLRSSASPMPTRHKARHKLTSPGPTTSIRPPSAAWQRPVKR
jgi:hypothetical protein